MSANSVMNDLNQLSLSEFNPESLISDVINFGILAADDFVIIERPCHRNRNRPHGPTPCPLSRQGQPLIRMLPMFVPIFVPQLIYYPVIRQCNHTTQYFNIPPIWHYQISRPVPAPIIPAIQIREIEHCPNQVSSEEQNPQPAESTSTESSLNHALPVVTSAPNSEISIKKVEAKDKKIKTPYQGNRRSFGRFVCDNCLRIWQSGNTWANMWQVCFRCLEHVYPRWQVSQFSNSFLDAPPYLGNQVTPWLDKQHPQEFCGMCQSLGQNCRFLNYVNSK